MTLKGGVAKTWGKHGGSQVGLYFRGSTWDYVSQLPRQRILVEGQIRIKQMVDSEIEGSYISTLETVLVRLEGWNASVWESANVEVRGGDKMQ